MPSILFGSLIHFVVATTVGTLWYFDVAGAFTSVVQVLFFIFLGLFAINLLGWLVGVRLSREIPSLDEPDGDEYAPLFNRY